MRERRCDDLLLLCLVGTWTWTWTCSACALSISHNDQAGMRPRPYHREERSTWDRSTHAHIQLGVAHRSQNTVIDLNDICVSDLCTLITLSRVDNMVDKQKHM